MRAKSLDQFDFEKLEHFRSKYDVANPACCHSCFAQKFCFGPNYGVNYLKARKLEGEFYECDDLRATLLSAMRVKDRNLIASVMDRYAKDA